MDKELDLVDSHSKELLGKQDTDGYMALFSHSIEGAVKEFASKNNANDKGIEGRSTYNIVHEDPYLKHNHDKSTNEILSPLSKESERFKKQ